MFMRQESFLKRIVLKSRESFLWLKDAWLRGEKRWNAFITLPSSSENMIKKCINFNVFLRLSVFRELPY